METTKPHYTSNGVCYIHRVDGPADVTRNEYYLNGFQIPEAEFNSLSLEERNAYKIDEKPVFLSTWIVDELSTLNNYIVEIDSVNRTVDGQDVVPKMEKLLKALYDLREVFENS